MPTASYHPSYHTVWTGGAGAFRAGGMVGAERSLTADVAILGGGMVGMTAACALAEHGLRIAVVDAAPPEAQTDAGFDGRCSAVAQASVRMLEAISLWPHLAEKTQPILEIRVSDGPSRLFLHFEHDALDDAPLGQMVENRHLRQALFQRASELDTLTHIAPAKMASCERNEAGTALLLEDGRRVTAPVILGADGRNSRLRRDAGIRTLRWRYDQAGIVATVAHELPHCGIAHERFLSDGPFAILPITGNRSSLVWTAAAESEAAIMGLSERAFAAEVRRRMGDFLGAVEVTGPRWSYPLGLHLAERFIDRRLALIGDAAHGIHPIAGQGLNLGLRDVAALAEVLVEAARLGEDLGSEVVLERYQRWRRFDTLVLASATDGLNRLFSNNIAPVRLARDLGLAAVNRLPAAKRLFMQHARGMLGKRPRLLDGEPF